MLRFLPLSVLVFCCVAAVSYADKTSEANRAFAEALEARKEAAQVSPASVDELGSALSSGGAVPVIVTLRQPVAFRTMEAGAWDAPASLSVLHAQTAATADAVLARVGKVAKAKTRFANWAGFAADVEAAGMDALMNDPDVMAVELDRTVTAHTQQGLPQINAVGATRGAGTYDGRGVSIAIVDTGIDYNHQQLGGTGGTYPGVKNFPNSKVIGGWNTGDGATHQADPSPYVGGTAGHYHGTACAGTAAGDIPTGREVAASNFIGGVAHASKLYALKITPGTVMTTLSSNLYAAWDWCVTHKNDDLNNPLLIISTSFGGGRDYNVSDAGDSTGSAAALAATSAGITIFCSSGNDGFCDSIGSPASLSNAVAVGAVYDANVGTPGWGLTAGSCLVPAGGSYFETSTVMDKVCAFSNSSATLLDIFAPSYQNATTTLSNNFIQNFSGTSSACPYAAGAAAALQSAAKQILGRYLTAAEVKSYMTSAGNPITDWKSTSITKPRVNLGAAIFALDPLQPPVNDAFAGAQVVTTSSSPVSSSNANATREAGEPAHGEASVWYKMTVPNCNLTMTNTSTAATVTVYTGIALNALTQKLQLAPAATGTVNALAQDTVVYIAVTSPTAGQAGAFSFNWSIVTLMPASLVAPENGSALNTNSTADVTFSWQWNTANTQQFYFWFALVNENGEAAAYSEGYGPLSASATTANIAAADIAAERAAFGLAAEAPIYWNIGTTSDDLSAFNKLYSFTPPKPADLPPGVSSMKVDNGSGTMIDMPASWPVNTAMTVQLNMQSGQNVAKLTCNTFAYSFDQRVAADTDGSRVIGATAATGTDASPSQAAANAGYVKFAIAPQVQKTFAVTATQVPVTISSWEIE